MLVMSIERAFASAMVCGIFGLLICAIGVATVEVEWAQRLLRVIVFIPITACVAFYVVMVWKIWGSL